METLSMVLSTVNSHMQTTGHYYVGAHYCGSKIQIPANYAIEVWLEMTPAIMGRSPIWNYILWY